MQRDIPPELLPGSTAVTGIQERSVCRSPIQEPNKTDDDVTKGSTKAAEATVVELPNEDDPGSSPDEDWDDDHTSIRVDFHIFCNEGVRVDDEDSSSNDENDDAKVTSDLKAGK